MYFDCFEEILKIHTNTQHFYFGIKLLRHVRWQTKVYIITFEKEIIFHAKTNKSIGLQRNIHSRSNYGRSSKRNSYFASFIALYFKKYFKSSGNIFNIGESKYLRKNVSKKTWNERSIHENMYRYYSYRRKWSVGQIFVEKYRKKRWANIFFFDTRFFLFFFFRKDGFGNRPNFIVKKNVNR